MLIMDKHDKKQILETYFMIVHNLKKAQHLTNQCFHSELYGDGYLAKIDLIYHMAPIISKNKEISIFQNRLILKDEYKTSKELFFTPKNVKEIVRLYKEGKNICASSYMIREQYFNNDIGWFKSIVLSIDEEKILLEIERKISGRRRKEITSKSLGEMVMKKLQKLDKVAYVRFASVYRQFKDISQFMQEVKGMLHK